MGTSKGRSAPARLETGVPGLDEVLRGGLWKSGIYVVLGSPGTGKSILANQIAFHHVRAGGRAAYVTLLAETHARLLEQVGALSFFDPGAVGSSVRYLNAFAPIESGGLSALLDALRGAVRDHRATLLVLDGMVTAGMLARSKIDYKKFINELQTWVGLVGCTVIILTSAPAGNDNDSDPEHTMVDGLLELRTIALDMRAVRQLRVAKLRGSGFIPGAHHYLIGADGLRVFPRFEAEAGSPRSLPDAPGPASVGVARLDRMLGGGLRAGSMTLVLGSSGSGKTTLGLQFLAAGAAPGEPALHFGFYEQPDDIRRKGDRFGLDFSGMVERGALELSWHSPAEGILDVLAADLLERVRRRGIKRLFVDGLVGFKESSYLERLPGFFAALSHELAALGVTTVVTEETRWLLGTEVEVPTPGVSAIFQNIVFLGQMETGSQIVRLISVLKARDAEHDRSVCSFDIRKDGIQVGGPLRPPEDATARIAPAQERAARQRPRRKR